MKMDDLKSNDHDGDDSTALRKKAVLDQLLTLQDELSAIDDKKKTKVTDAAALKLLKSPSLLFDVGEQLQSMGLAGERKNALLLYLSGTSRLQEKIISIA